MLDGRTHSLRAQRAAPLPVGEMMRGKSREEVAELLPRLFNLCRSAQAMAARLALGMPEAEDSDALRTEILRDHILRLTMILPGHFGQSPLSLPTGWQSGGDLLAEALFGPQRELPDAPEAFDAFCQADTGVALLFQKISSLFHAGEAVSDALPFVSGKTGLDPLARVENSCAVRVQDHPVVTAVEKTHGRGPLWRVVARAYDLQAMLQGTPLLARSPQPGVAQVPATRGLYTVQAETEADLVTRFARVTPTDHLQARGGVMDQTLASLGADRTGLAPLVIDILDPCSPIRVTEVAHA